MTETNDQITIENKDIPGNILLIVDGWICEKFQNNSRKNFTYKIVSAEYLKNKVEIKKDSPYLSNSRCIYVKFRDKFDNEVFLKEINYNLSVLFNEKEIYKFKIINVENYNLDIFRSN